MNRERVIRSTLKSNVAATWHVETFRSSMGRNFCPNQNGMCRWKIHFDVMQMNWVCQWPRPILNMVAHNFRVHFIVVENQNAIHNQIKAALIVSTKLNKFFNDLRQTICMKLPLLGRCSFAHVLKRFNYRTINLKTSI